MKRPLILGGVLVGFFAAWAAWLPAPWTSAPPARGALLLFGAVALFRVLAGFEKGRNS